jgi:hypothetical protein
MKAVLAGTDVNCPYSELRIDHDTNAGNLKPNSTYGYAVTLLLNEGETNAIARGEYKSTIVGSAKIHLPAVPREFAHAVKRLYRTEANGREYYHLGDAAANQITFVDTVMDNKLSDAQLPTHNSAHSAQKLCGFIGFTQPMILSVAKVATGSLEEGSTPLTAEFNVITDSSRGKYVMLPKCSERFVGMRIGIKNKTEDEVYLRPGMGDRIGDNETDTAIILPETSITWMIMLDDESWEEC